MKDDFRSMKLSVAILLTLVSLGPSTAKSQEDTSVTLAAFPRWYTSVESAMQAGDTGKVSILISFETEWCRWCAAMRDSVWTSPGWREFEGKVLFVRADGDVDTALADRYKVSRYPSIVLVTSGEQEIERWVGYSQAEALQDAVGAALKGTGTMWDLERQLTVKSNDAAILYAIGKKYLLRGDPGRAEDHFARALAVDQQDEAGVADDVLFAQAQLLRDERSWFKAIEAFRRLVKKYPKSEWCEDAELYVAWLYGQSGDTTEAVKQYEKFLDHYKGSSETQWVQRQLEQLSPSLEKVE